MKKILTTLATLFLLSTYSVKAEIQYGIGFMAGQFETSGTETEGTAADTSDRSKTVEEFFVGADIFVELVSDNGMTYGLSYVPLDLELGSGKRTDVNGDDPAENDDGTRTASADVSDLITLYTNIPMGSNGWYALLGGHMATIETNETLNASSYGNEDVTGYMVGFGQRSGKLKYEFSYSDFSDIALTATGGNSNSITADADALTFRISYGF